MASPTESLLIELLTEELPPKALKRLGQSFATTLADRLAKEGVCDEHSVTTAYAAPRRLAVHITHVHAKAPDQTRREKLLPVNIAIDAQGQATAPLIKKLSTFGAVLGQNISLDQLERVSDGKQDVLIYQYLAPGATLPAAAQSALDDALAQLPIPKVMSYQRPDGQTVKFVRPAHRLLALHGDSVLKLQVLGLAADRVTEGHRFHCATPISIAHANDYAESLEKKGKVIASFESRRAKMQAALTRLAGSHQVVAPDSLLDEVCSLVEWPVVLEAKFEPEFLSVPQECLILTMQQNQKYFALTDSSGKLVNRFLLVSNIESKDPQVVISGNERVLRARLSDAKFFFDQDRKKTLESRTAGLANVVYHNKIGHLRSRIDRLAQLAGLWASAVGADPRHAQRAALLAKADLLTDMVGEFPELQGVMGTYYARHDHEPEEVAQAIEGHYHPRFSGDTLPAAPTAIALALADKMETLVGIWGIGLAPTGDKDPFALRRHALGVVRILVERALPLSLSALLADTARAFSQVPAVQPDAAAILAFVTDRLRAWLKEKGYTAEEIEAVVAISADRLDQVIPRLEALRAFMMQPEAQSLCSANKRISNLLKKSAPANSEVRSELLREEAEKTLAQALAKIAPKAESAAAQSDFGAALTSLAQLKEPVDAFFDGVMVMAEDPALRENRLALMQSLHRAMNQVADLARLAI